LSFFVPKEMFFLFILECFYKILEVGIIFRD